MNLMMGTNDTFITTPHKSSTPTPQVCVQGRDNSSGGMEINIGRKQHNTSNNNTNVSGVRQINNKAAAACAARGHWRPHEDAKLKELVAQFGPQNWNIIADKLHGRSGKSCRLRWFNQLDPRINRRAFSEEEEERLLTAHKMYGNKWALIARLFPGRTDNAVKNHWHVIMARKQREDNSSSTVYRRRKPNSYLPNKELSLLNTNACSDQSTISNNNNNNVDDHEYYSGASTCTDLSLTPNSAKVPCFLTRFSPVHHQLGEESEKKVCAISDSNSGVSASESVIVCNNNNNMANVYMYGEGKNNNDKNDKFEKPNMAFIDFLGVGAT